MLKRINCSATRVIYVSFPARHCGLQHKLFELLLSSDRFPRIEETSPGSAPTTAPLRANKPESTSEETNMGYGLYVNWCGLSELRRTIFLLTYVLPKCLR